MAVNRVLYATQTTLITENGGGTNLLPVSTASADETIPQEDVLVLGKLGSVGRLQKDVATCKGTLKAFICSVVKDEAAGAGTSSTIMGTMLTDLATEARAGKNATVEVKSNNAGESGGFKMLGVLNSVGIDAAKGAFPTLDLGFEGIGSLETLEMGDTTTSAKDNAGSGYVKEATPHTSKDVEVSGAGTDTVASAKFSFDMPTESLSRLGGKIVGKTSIVSADNAMFSKPPFKATMTVDGQDLSASGGAAGAVAANGKIVIATGGAGLTVEFDGAKAISAQSYSQNVGDVGATYSVTVEGTNAKFS
jgi:hypothetical protein